MSYPKIYPNLLGPSYSPSIIKKNVDPTIKWGNIPKLYAALKEFKNYTWKIEKNSKGQDQKVIGTSVDKEDIYPCIIEVYFEVDYLVFHRISNNPSFKYYDDIKQIFKKLKK